ncbi:MAG TPA: hypothetical protein VFH63_11055 [candidate division Zixibacteria bacterium]|nr:hypothetical protein [candidate division Zixibacteria bacterium]
MPRRNADDNLAAENYPTVNRAYYAAEPADYFQERFDNLLLTGGGQEARAEAIRKGGSFGALKFGEATGKPDAAEPEAGSGKSAEHFVLAESEILAHHVGETLLRLYLAHESLPACPALEMARVRGPARFRHMVRSRFVESPYDGHEFRTSVSQIFQLVADPAGLRPTPDKEMWWASVENIELFLRHFATQFLDSGLYSSAKHGMALTPTEFGFAYGESALTRHRGPAIFHLEQRPDSRTGNPRWFTTYRWVRPDQQAAMTFMGIKLIRSLWRMARIRYTEKVVRGAEFFFFDKPRFDQLLATGSDTGVTWTAMSMEMLYWADSDASAPEES